MSRLSWLSRVRISTQTSDRRGSRGLGAGRDQNLKWESLHEAAKRRIEVDLDEVERVLEIARRTPGLSTYERELQQLSIFFQVATRHYRDQAPTSWPPGSGHVPS